MAASYADLVALPPHVVGELVEGELHVSPRPAPRYAVAKTALGGELNGAFQRGRGGPGGWWILFEPELHLGDDVLVPDIAGWRRDRLPVPPDEPSFTLAPDWICEVLSPGTSGFDRRLKMPLYAREGVKHAWIVDPQTKTLEVYRLEGTFWLQVGTYGPDEPVRAEPFEAVEIALGDLWIPEIPPTP